MKIIISLLFTFISLIYYNTSIAEFTDLVNGQNRQTPYCNNNDCSLTKGIQDMKTGINDIEKDRTASVYIQDIVKYLLGFITLLAVIYIIYSGFQIMISGGSEDKVKKSKTTIVYIFVGIIIIWLSYSIVTFIMNVINYPVTVN